MTKSSPDSGKDATPADHAKGHRAHMRIKLIEKGSVALTKLEILEMLLYAGAPRGDTKPLAKRLIKTFKSLPAVLRASPDDLRPIKDMGGCRDCHGENCRGRRSADQPFTRQGEAGFDTLDESSGLLHQQTGT